MSKAVDTTKLLTGKDGKLYITVDSKSKLISEVDTFNVSMNVTNIDYQPIGSILSYAVNTGVSYTLTFSEAVVRDDLILSPLLSAIKAGKMPTYDFIGSIKRQDGETEKISFSKCTPDGTVGIMNLTPGEVIKREQSFRINRIPKIMSEFLEEEKEEN